MCSVVWRFCFWKEKAQKQKEIQGNKKKAKKSQKSKEIQKARKGRTGKFYGPTRHILCESPFISRDFYAISTKTEGDPRRETKKSEEIPKKAGNSKKARKGRRSSQGQKKRKKSQKSREIHKARKGRRSPQGNKQKKQRNPKKARKSTKQGKEGEGNFTALPACWRGASARNRRK